MTFASLETVFEPQPAPWTDHFAMAYNPDAKEYLLLKLKMDRSGFAYTAFFSADAKHWQEHPGQSAVLRRGFDEPVLEPGPAPICLH